MYLFEQAKEQIESLRRFLKPSHLLTNIEINKYYQDEARFSVFYSRNNLPKIKDGAYVISFDKNESVGTHWIAFYMETSNYSTYFENFDVKHIPKKIKTFLGNRGITTNTFRIQTYKSIWCGYFFIGFIDSCVMEKAC